MQESIMKKFISIILVLSLLAVFSVNAFAEREIVSFETLFESQLPTYLFDVTEFEAGGEYVVYVSTPRNQDHFQADGGAFEGVRGTIVRKDIVCNNAEIITIEEDENFNYIITFMPINEGEFSLEFTMRVFGFDIIGDDYRTILGDEWTYTFATEPLPVAPSSDPIYVPGVSGSSSTSADVSQTASNTENTSSEDLVTPIKEDSSVWVWVIVGIAAAAVCAVVVVVISKKKLVK